MNLKLKKKFQRLWKKHFDDTELSIIFYYTDEKKVAENDPTTSGQCFLANLIKVRKGTPLRFGIDSIGCPGGRRYAGFSGTISKNFEYFLSCGIPGIVEGERYKKSPELVRARM
jgi:hypothetical protein